MICDRFRGTLKKVHIVTDNVRYRAWGRYEPYEEVEQHLTINNKGGVWFTAYNFGHGGERYEKGRTRIFKIDEEKTSRLFSAITDYFGNRDSWITVCDRGCWKMELTNTEGETFEFEGSVIDDSDYRRLSNILRESIGMEDLFAFDGYEEPDITKIVVDYHRVKKVGQGERLAGWDYLTWENPGELLWDNKEQLIIDRKTETLEHIRNIGTECKISRKFEVKGGIKSLFESFGEDDLFANVKGNPDDAIETPDDTKDYRITVYYKNSPPDVIEGSYDKNGLPDDFSYFAEAVSGFMRFYGIGELLDPSIYGKVKRSRSEYIFCSVVFEFGSRSYYYLTDDDSIEIGDVVIVPVGQDNCEKVAEVENIEYFKAENAPMPIEKVKRIIRKRTDE